MTNKDKWDALYLRMEKIGMKEDDIVEKFILGSGRGGQNLQKTSSCVYLKHLPSGLEVKCQQTRSRDQNRFFARRELFEKLEQEILGEKSKKQQEMEKIRRQKQRKTRKQKAKMVEDKKQRSSVKEGRSPQRAEE
jgi:protein subunit release factor B